MINQSAYGIAILYGQSTPLFFLAGPLFLFYVRSILKEMVYKIKWRDWFHFIPFTISLISLLPYYLKPFNTKLNIANLIIQQNFHFEFIEISWLYPYKYNMYGRALLMAIYSSVCLIMVLMQEKETRKKTITYQTKRRQFILGSLCNLTSVTTFATISYSIFLLKAAATSTRGLQLSNNVFSILSIFGYSSIPIMMLIYPEILYGIRRTRQPISENLMAFFFRDKTKLHNDGHTIIDKELLSRNSKLILQYMNDEKPFLDPKFNIDSLAETLSMPKHLIQECFKYEINKKFTETRTKFRIEYAKNLLLSKEFAILSMEGIWSKSGFSSKTIFFTSFKEETGITPIEFVKLNTEAPKR
jgi:AraC-like DNA-binding protein